MGRTTRATRGAKPLQSPDVPWVPLDTPTPQRPQRCTAVARAMVGTQGRWRPRSASLRFASVLGPLAIAGGGVLGSPRDRGLGREPWRRGWEKESLWTR
jgi:hypothetical protein